LETTNKTDFARLVSLEPRLGVLLKYAQTIPLADDFLKIWYRQIKPQMVNLVGFKAEKRTPELMSTIAYDCAYRTIYNALENRY